MKLLRKNTLVVLAILAVGIVSIYSILFYSDPAKTPCKHLYEGALKPFSSNSSIDPTIQDIVDSTLKEKMRSTNSKKGLIAVQEIATGKIVSIGAESSERNMKCFDGWAEAFKEWEPGSVIKPLMAATAINENKIRPSDEFYNSGVIGFGDYRLLNAINIPTKKYTYQDMITKSINIGAVSALEKLGDDSRTISPQSRETWHSYLTHSFAFGKPTGAYRFEQSGFIRKPKGGDDIERRYANMSFGIGMTVTPVQLLSAYAGIINDGRYVSPQLQSSPGSGTNYRQIVTPATSKTITQMLITATATSNRSAVRNGYLVGGKSGTGPSADGAGVYQYYKSVGTYIGFIGKNKPKYVVIARLDEPESEEVLAGVEAARLWAKVTNRIIDNGSFL